MIKGAFLGAVLVGPFLMEKPDSLLILDIAKHFHMPVESLLELYDSSNDILLVSPALGTQISRLKVKTGNVQEAKGILNDLLGYVLFSEGSDLPTVKARAMELSSLLSRTAIEGGASTNNILRINNQFLKTLTDILNMDDLCLKLQKIVEIFTDCMFNGLPSKNSEITKKVFAYIAINYASPVTLEEIANHVHLNPAYFSTVFKQSCRSSFKEYLNMVRIKESKRLLSNTDYSIIDIAVATGFEDQSYFSKVFKKYTGLTPKQFRL